MSEDDVPTIVPSQTDHSASVPFSGRSGDPYGGDSIPARGSHIGPFVVADKLGSGAMGVVLRAIDPELDRAVAIKIMTAGLGGPQAHARFVREARAAAKLQHPNVVTVHQAGTHEGRAYVVMECVQGGTLRSWLGEDKRSPKEILAVFVQAGRGLAAAHAAGLVHRDFKPDNVLIDDVGRARVSDFGLVGHAGESVETLDPDLSAVSEPLRLTQTGAVLGTPAYMAPEQIAGDPIDARADQFSFCVTLYEALWNERPYPAYSLADLVARLGQGPRQPSDRVVPRRIRQAVLRGLSPDASLRHRNMDALLDALAVTRAPSRRQWTALAATTAIAGVLGATAFQALDDNDSQCQSVAGLPVAWSPAQKHQVVGAFAALERADGATLSAAVAEHLDAQHEALARAVDSACTAADRQELSPMAWDRQRTCLQTHDTELAALGDALTKLDDGTSFGALPVVLGLPAPGRCVGSEGAPGYSTGPDTAAVREARAEVWRLELLAVGARTTDVVTQGAKLLPKLRQLEAGSLVARTIIMRVQAGAYQGPSTAGDDALREAVTAAAAKGDSIHEARASALLMTRALRDPERTAEAEGLAGPTQAAAARAADGRTESFVAMAMAQLHSVRGDAQAALASVQSAIDTAELSGHVRPDELAYAYCARGMARERQQDGDAPADFVRAEQIVVEALGAAHPSVGMTLLCTGAAHLSARRLTEAHDAFSRSATILEHALGPNSSNTIAAVVQAGRAAMELPDADAARVAYADALERCTASVACDSNLHTTILENLAWAELTTRRFGSAAKHYRAALAVYEMRPGDKGPNRARIHEYLGYTQDAAGHHELAQREFAQMREAAISMHGPKHTTVIQATNLAANSARYQGDCETARDGYRRALALRVDLALTAGPYLAEAMLGMGACELEHGDLTAAAETLQTAFDLRETELDPFVHGEILFRYAQLLVVQGKSGEAEPFAAQARQRLVNTGVPRDAIVRTVDQWILDNFSSSP